MGAGAPGSGQDILRFLIGVQGVQSQVGSLQEVNQTMKDTAKTNEDVSKTVTGINSQLTKTLKKNKDLKRSLERHNNYSIPRLREGLTSAAAAAGQLIRDFNLLGDISDEFGSALSRAATRSSQFAGIARIFGPQAAAIAGLAGLGFGFVEQAQTIDSGGSGLVELD